jgi:hypothetical protein
MGEGENMIRRTSSSVVVALLFLVLAVGPSQARAADGRPDRVPVTDPTELEAMGLPRDAKNVFKLVGADLQTSAAALEGDQKYYGGSSGFSAAGARTFQGRRSVFGYDCAICSEDIFNTNPATENFAEAQLEVPNGAILEILRGWWQDTNATHDISIFLFETCVPFAGAGPNVQTTLASINSTGSAGDGSFGLALPAGTTANTTDCTYRVRARFGNGSLTGPGDATLRLYKARLQWRRQVSPAPAVATFTDVPVGHPQFRFVEALVSSGITGGCGGGNFCPDQGLTRGQMAVFLSVALGLDFGF